MNQLNLPKKSPQVCGSCESEALWWSPVTWTAQPELQNELHHPISNEYLVSGLSGPISDTLGIAGHCQIARENTCILTPLYP